MPSSPFHSELQSVWVAGVWRGVAWAWARDDLVALPVFALQALRRELVLDALQHVLRDQDPGRPGVHLARDRSIYFLSLN